MRGLDRELDIAFDLPPHRLDPLVVELAQVSEHALVPRQRVLRLPLLDERRVAHVREVRAHRVLHPPERLHLEERRPGSVPRSLERARNRVLDGEHVVPVHDLAGHPVAAGAVGEILDGALRPPVGRERVLVVLADEDDRQRPGRGEVHRLVRRALPGGAVAEEGDRRLPRPAQLRGQRRAAGMWKPGADDPVAAEDVEREVGDVHRAAEPLAVARSLAEHLGHHPAQVGSGRDQVAVGAVMPDEIVGVPHRARRADGDRLLPDAAVRGPEDDALLEELRGAILEAADQRHQAVLLEQRRPVGGPLAHRRSPGRPLVELEDVAVRVERVEALAARVHARGLLHRPVGAERDALRQQLLVELLDPGDEDAEVAGAVVRGR